MPASCKDIRAAVAACLQNSDCVLIERNTPADCIKEPLKDTLPTQCQQLLHGYGQCKRGMIDMRKRFRGNKPIATSLELEAGGGKTEVKPVPMLYAGKSGFEDPDEDTKKAADKFETYTRNDGIEDLRKK